MIELIRTHQLNIMLFLCGTCGILLLLMFFTRFISKSRKTILLLMELMAMLLLWFDRLAYIYSGDSSTEAWYMVRVSNFFVFFLTSGVVLVFNMYIADFLKAHDKVSALPRRLRAVRWLSLMGMLMAVISAFTDFYYYFDEMNVYHRGQGFLIAYIIPVVCPVVQFTIIRQFRAIFSRLIYISLALYIFVPIICGILQIFMYGISIVNMSMVAVSVSLYIFTYIDINNAVERAHEIEIRNMQSEQEHMRRLFDQTATAFVSAVEKKDDFVKGNSVKIAEYARRIARLSGKSDEDCEKVYYAALLHDVGMIGIPDSVIKNSTDPSKPDHEKLHKKPLIGKEILSCITEYPYLWETAYYSHERYNGTGYPEGLKGEEIPETARIVAVADAYVTMRSRKRYREPRPDFVVREAFIKDSGEKFDPVYADIMVKIIDADSKTKNEGKDVAIETALSCGRYRAAVSAGITVERAVRKISFRCSAADLAPGEFSVPSIVLFDSYDERVHTDEKTIKEYNYLEYGELWFDGHMISTAARKMEETRFTESGTADGSYTITAAKFEDHVRLEMCSPSATREITIALPDRSRSVYIGITGEHCEITELEVAATGKTIGEQDIPRIAKAVSYTDHIESDIANLQIDRTRSASTEGIEIDRKITVRFHTMSLPGANLIWHCPYVVLFSSEDGLVGGPGYREFAFVKLNGENDDTNKTVPIKFSMKKKPDFPGWEVWKEQNRKGMECEVTLERKGSRIILGTENLGIEVECSITVEESDRVYASLTGDQVALTDIRVI